MLRITFAGHRYVPRFDIGKKVYEVVMSILDMDTEFEFMSGGMGKEYYDNLYDEIVIPDEISGVYYKAAISKRNRWVVDHADYLITYITTDHGGAYNTFRYALRKDCKIIEVH